VSRVLIVDDESALLDALSTLLADEGYPVRTAPVGQVALEMIAAKPPDLLIKDVMTPGLGSWTLFAQVRERTTCRRL
jgi:diguanylate cyclase